MFRRMSFGTDNFFDITLCIDSAIKFKSRFNGDKGLIKRIVVARKTRETWAEDGPWQADNPEFFGGHNIFSVAIISPQFSQYFLGGNYFSPIFTIFSWWQLFLHNFHNIFLVAIISGKMHSGSVPLFLRREIECRGSCHSAGREELGLGKNFFARRGVSFQVGVRGDQQGGLETWVSSSI